LDLQVPPQPFGGELEQYLQVLRDQRGLASSTLENHRAHVGNFLKWIAGHNLLLSEITAADVASYIRFKRETCSVLTVSTAAQPLRSFFTYGESQHWCVPNLRDVLTFPNRRRYDPDTVIPTWEDVRRVLDEAIGNKPADLRNRAMLLLCSIYGLRSSEVARVRLGDIDWKEETLSITRSKNGRTQQFPLQYEIGEAILKYLIHGRPQCSCRNVFVSLNCPYRPITPTTLNLVTATRMALLQIKSTKMGPHALRHACATQLLRSGTSLRQIADFLGHRDLSTVSVYARLDTEALREVAGFSLKAILCN
jgi:site-specific recombinase XerD